VGRSSWSPDRLRLGGGVRCQLGRGESPRSAGSRRPGRVSSQASTSDWDSTKPAGGRGSRWASAKVRASRVAGRQCITSASIRRANARAVGAVGRGRAVRRAPGGRPIYVRACRPGTARVRRRPIFRRTAFRAAEAGRPGFGTTGSLRRMRAWIAFDWFLSGTARAPVAATVITGVPRSHARQSSTASFAGRGGGMRRSVSAARRSALPRARPWPPGPARGRGGETRLGHSAVFCHDRAPSGRRKGAPAAWRARPKRATR
jgi:hypothetical protein